MGRVNMPVSVFQSETDSIGHNAVAWNIECPDAETGHFKTVVQEHIGLVVDYGVRKHLSIFCVGKCRCHADKNA